MTKASELRELADQELAERIEQDTKDLFNLRFDIATAQVADTARIGNLKREIARLRTIARERAAAAKSGE